MTRTPDNTSMLNSSRRRTRLVLAGVACVIVVAALFAIGSSGDEPSGDSSTVTTTTSVDSPGPGEYQPVIVEGAALVPRGDGSSDQAVGVDAPILRGYDSSHNAVEVIPGSDGPVMLVFLAHWCPHCNREVPRLLEWKSRGLVPEGLRVVGITTGSREDLPNWPPSQWLDEFEWPWEVLADSQGQEAALAYGVDGYPFMVLINGGGKVAHRMSGEVEVEELDKIVRNTLAVN